MLAFLLILNKRDHYFKEDVADIRNTKAIDIYHELKTYDLNVDIYDPWANSEEARHEYGIESYNKLPDTKYDAVILAVAHKTLGTEC